MRKQKPTRGKTTTFNVQHTDLETWGVDEHSEKVGPHLFKLHAGASMHIKQPDGRRDLCTVSRSCGENNGYWYCASCEQLFHNNFEKDGHIHEPEKDHYLVWMCADHGPEQP